MRLPSLSYLFTSWLGAAKRFPFATAVSLIATVCGMFLIAQDHSQPVYESAFQLLLTCILFFPLFITLVAAKESYDSSLGGHLIANVLVAVLMILYWKFYSPEAETFNYIIVARFFLFTSVAHLLVTFIPFLKRSDLNDFWEYNRQLFIQFFTGMLYAILIYAGLVLALLAVKYLFNIDFNNELFGHLFVAVAGVFHTSYFLSNFPKQYRFNIAAGNFHRGFVNLVKFVFISLVALYFIILYSYGLKILISRELPQGWVSILVINFSIVGILTYLLNYLLPEIEGSGWVKTFRKYFFYVLPGAVILLLIAIMRRINDYGITEERYFVLITGIWLACISLYFIFSKKDDIRAIPISLAVACLITAVGGPISAFSVSERSQINRLKGLLSEAGILKDGKIYAANPELEGENGAAVKSIVSYLSQHNHLSALSEWIPVDSLFTDSDSRYAKTNKILNEFGVSSKAGSGINRNRNRYYSSVHREPVDIRSYDFYTKFNVYENNNRTPKVDYYFTILDEGNSIVFHKNETNLDTLDLAPLINILEKDFTENAPIPIQQMSHLHNGNSFDFLLTLTSIHISHKEKTTRIKHLEGDVFWKEK